MYYKPWHILPIGLGAVMLAIIIKKMRQQKIINTLLPGGNTPNNNVKAFLDVIRYAEGTSASDGYNYLFGSRPGNNIRFNDFSKHPNRHRPFGNTTSTAAGAYQILFKTWREAKAALSLKDFSPTAQDAAAIFLIKRRGALDDVIAGRFTTAIYKLNKEWASLPGSPYGQPTKSLASLQTFYSATGGRYA